MKSGEGRVQRQIADMTRSGETTGQVLAYPQFGVPPNMPPGPGGSYPPSSQDYRYYSSKFSSAGSRMQKKLRQRCTWPCTAIILLLLCVALLACTGYFAGE
ncbi:teneurin-m-like isoform X7 [Elysia marginata]|uniref:Teneurin-m-like isoform X7 n=1 Tax=Elysia marginata TaxID=1093978 RepID=A0AAV4GLI8_9GAST|nr:teneurin-m-like isoform X7 [Elysia marginata]